MPLEESFYSEPPAAPAPSPEPVAELAPEPVAELPTEAASVPEPTPAVEAPEVAEVTEASVEAAPAPAPAFDEAAYLRQHFGDDAPPTAAELRQQLEAARARQLTPELETRLAVLNDPAKLAEYAALAGKDYDKPDAAAVMREHFAQQHPGMSDKLVEFRFQQEFAQKYPTLAAALSSPEDIDASDPQLLLEKEAADYDARTARTALKATQQEATQKFVSAVAAAPAPQLTSAQQADAAALPAWLDEAYADGATLPVDLGEGQALRLPIGKSADFKADFNRTVALMEAQSFTKDGLLNRGNHALLTRFLQVGPQAFAQEIAQQVRAAQPKPAPAIPVADLTNSSAARRAQLAATPPAAERVYNEGTRYQNFNY